MGRIIVQNDKTFNNNFNRNTFDKREQWIRCIYASYIAKKYNIVRTD